MYLPVGDVWIKTLALPLPPLFLAVTETDMLLNSSTLLTKKALLDPDTVRSMVVMSA